MFNCFLNNTLFLLLPKINFCLSYVHYHRAEKCNFLENDLAWFENLGWIKLTLGTNYLSFFSSEWTSVINYPSCFLADALINYTFKISPVKFTKYFRIFFHNFFHLYFILTLLMFICFFELCWIKPFHCNWDLWQVKFDSKVDPKFYFNTLQTLPYYLNCSIILSPWCYPA